MSRGDWCVRYGVRAWLRVSGWVVLPGQATALVAGWRRLSRPCVDVLGSRLFTSQREYCLGYRR